MTQLLLIWLALFGVLLTLLTRASHRAGALTLSYFLAMALIHVPGALTYISEPDGFHDTFLGLQPTVLGVAFFVAGVGAARYFGVHFARSLVEDSPIDPEWLSGVARKFFLIGLFIFFIAIPIVAQVPGMTAIVSAFVGLVVVGIWMWLCAAMIKRDRQSQILILALLPVLPFATLAAGGFVSFSTQWILTILSFFFIMVRRRLWLVLLMPFAFYFSLSMFIAYLGERNAIRDAVWYEEADIRTRLERIGDIFVNFELLDLNDPKHIAALDARLNQNMLVGAAVSNIENGTVDYAFGSTVPWWAVIPRAVWPEKPEVGGGRTIVSDFTGLYFPEGTSVGAGQVLEFYVNFGIVGVIVGFFAWGFLLMTIDRRIVRAMAESDMASLLRFSMVGLTLVNPGGNLLEILIAAIGAYIATPLIFYLDRKLRSRAGLQP